MKSNKKGVLMAIALGSVITVAGAQEQPSGESEQGLLIPEDLTYNAGSKDQGSGSQLADGERGLDFYEETRVGGRLERVTVKRDGGFTEFYKNNRHDELWSGPEDDLGEVQNQRQWKIGSW